jgi:hypothetical protein
MSNSLKNVLARYYTGIGSRETPTHICAVMTTLANVLEKQNFILRSGGALGADSAFEKGVVNPNNKMIFLSGALRNSFGNNILYSDTQLQNARIFIFNNNIHPIWQRLPEYAKALHTRNVFQVLGMDMNEISKFTVCWTRDSAIDFETSGRKTGGTGTAIKISCHYKVPVFNLSIDSHLRKILSYIKLNVSDNVFSKLVEDIPCFDF